MDEIWRGPVEDSYESHEVVGSHVQFSGAVWDVRSDDVLIGAHAVTRDLVVHPGAVGVIALDEQDRVLLIRQYRHPVGGYLFEPPAGLLDTHRETAWDCARRELAEEAGLRADTWHVLIDFLNSPAEPARPSGVSLARGVNTCPKVGAHRGGRGRHTCRRRGYLDEGGRPGAVRPDPEPDRPTESLLPRPHAAVDGRIFDLPTRPGL